MEECGLYNTYYNDKQYSIQYNTIQVYSNSKIITVCRAEPLGQKTLTNYKKEKIMTIPNDEKTYNKKKSKMDGWTLPKTIILKMIPNQDTKAVIIHIAKS